MPSARMSFIVSPTSSSPALINRARQKILCSLSPQCNHSCTNAMMFKLVQLDGSCQIPWSVYGLCCLNMNLRLPNREI